MTAFAHKLGISRQTAHVLLSGRTALTPEMAVRLGKFCGNGPGVWLRMQQALDLWQAERSVDVSAIETVRAAWRRNRARLSAPALALPHTPW